MKTITLIILVTIFCSPIMGQDFFEFTGDKTSVQFSEGQERTVLDGNARVVSDTLVLTADYIELYGVDFRFMRCVGNINYNDSEQEMTLLSGILFFDRETKYAQARERVEVEDLKNDIRLKSTYLEIINNGSNITAQTNTRIFREDLIARAEILQFNRDNETLQLLGFPIAYWKDDEYKAQKIVIDLRKDTVALVGQVSGVIKPGSDEDDNTDGETSTAPEENVPVEPLSSTSGGPSEEPAQGPTEEPTEGSEEAPTAAPTEAPPEEPPAGSEETTNIQ